MPLSIGGPRGPKGPELLVALTECHERIRRFSALAVRLAEPAPPEQLAQAAAEVHRYFTVALPLHAADEDRSLSPRLVAAAPELADLLARMTEEHLPLHALVDTLVPDWLALARDPSQQAALAERLSAAARLRALFDAHLRPEEEQIFPTAMRALPPAVQAEILAEMRARRRG